MVDQPYWARRVHDLGAGPRPIPRHRLTASALAEAIHTAVTDNAMRLNTARLAKAIGAEGGPTEAASIIGRLASG
jgi:UDP:flavonoid glycosyltransferase YjiC (YdhE family)